MVERERCYLLSGAQPVLYPDVAEEMKALFTSMSHACGRENVAAPPSYSAILRPAAEKLLAQRVGALHEPEYDKKEVSKERGVWEILLLALVMSRHDFGLHTRCCDTCLVALGKNEGYSLHETFADLTPLPSSLFPLPSPLFPLPSFVQEHRAQSISMMEPDH